MQKQKSLTDVQRWIDEPEHACPLIVYTNVARDYHNNHTAEAFAIATGQEYEFYHAKDTRGGGGKNSSLAAWPLKLLGQYP